MKSETRSVPSTGKVTLLKEKVRLPVRKRAIESHGRCINPSFSWPCSFERNRVYSRTAAESSHYPTSDFVLTGSPITLQGRLGVSLQSERPRYSMPSCPLSRSADAKKSGTCTTRIIISMKTQCSVGGIPKVTPEAPAK